MAISSTNVSRVSALDKDAVDYYGFVASSGEWKIVDAEGNEATSDVIDLVTDSVTHEQTVVAKAPGTAYVKYFIPENTYVDAYGNVSTNASGMRGVKYGATRDYVKAMTVVLPTGEITHFGSSVSKTSSGYNLLHLMIGSEGTLGIITELTLKLIPAPKAAVSLVVPFEDLASCIAMVPKLRHSGLNPQAIEFFEKAILVTSETYLKKQVFPRVVDGVDVGAYLLITFDGESEEALNPIIERAAELLLDQGALDVLVADSAPTARYLILPRPMPCSPEIWPPSSMVLA